jgi:monoamine oxidase
MAKSEKPKNQSLVGLTPDQVNCLFVLKRKRLALRTTTYTAATKVVMAFKYPFWERENGKENKGGSTLTDLHIKQIYYPQKSNMNLQFNCNSFRN